MRVCGSLIGGVLFAASLPAPAYADCRVLSSRMFPGVESQSRMYTSPGRSCGVVVHAGGSS
jgi:hypothetical protein